MSRSSPLHGGSRTPIKVYTARCHDLTTGQKAQFVVRALTETNADMQARDGFFGLLGVDPEKRAALQVVLVEHGETPSPTTLRVTVGERCRHKRTGKAGTLVELVNKTSGRVLWNNGARGIAWLRDLERVDAKQ